MDFKLIPSKLLLQQLSFLNKKTLRIINTKIALLRIHPYRNKRIQASNILLFRIRFEDGRKEKRLIYLVDKPHILLLGILDRNDNYADLKELLRKNNLL